MSSIIPSGGASGTGSMTLLAPNTNSNQVCTFPDVTGTAMVSGNMPAFSVVLANSNQSISNNTNTKVAFDGVLYDTNNNWSTSNYRFTPTVAGYYQFNASTYFANSSAGLYQIKIYKNGSEFLRGNSIGGGSGASTSTGISAMVQANGTTDYFEIWCYTSAGTQNIVANTPAPYVTWFNGSLIRAS
jgi:hypothetical protein